MLTRYSNQNSLAYTKVFRAFAFVIFAGKMFTFIAIFFENITRAVRFEQNNLNFTGPYCLFLRSFIYLLH